MDIVYFCKLYQVHNIGKGKGKDALNNFTFIKYNLESD